MPLKKGMATGCLSFTKCLCCYTETMGITSMHMLVGGLHGRRMLNHCAIPAVELIYHSIDKDCAMESHSCTRTIIKDGESVQLIIDLWVSIYQ